MDCDRYLLTIAMLDGEPDAQHILADLLEEQGDVGVAQWARARKRHVVPRLELAIGLLPHRAALSLACDFAEHVIESRRTNWWAPNISDGFEPLRSWLLGAASDDDLIAACMILDCDSHYADPYDRSPAQRKVCCALAGAAQSARLAARHAATQSPKTHHYEQECATDARKTARYARDSRPRNDLPAQHQNRRHETQWQITRTRNLLVDLTGGLMLG